MSPLLSSLLATVWVSAIALIGIVFFFARQPGERGEAFLLSFAAGVLLATAFLELMPEALRVAPGDTNIFVATLLAMIGFFLLERFLHGFHEHEEAHAVGSRYLILIGDGLHNFIDGVAIAASFAVAPEVGLATTLAVTVHEVPQELADYAVLVAGGFTRQQALVLNFLSGLTSVLGALVFFAFAHRLEAQIGWFMAATAGMFIYIAASDLIPHLPRQTHGLHAWVHLPFLLGIALIALLMLRLGH